MIQLLLELILKMDQFKLQFLFRAFQQEFKLMIFFQKLKVRLFSLMNATSKLIIAGQSFWKNFGLGLMLTMNEQLQGGSMKLSLSLLDYPQRIIFLLSIMPIKLGLLLNNILMMDIFQGVELSEMVTIQNPIKME